VEVRKGKNLDLKYIQRGKDGLINVTTKKKGQSSVPRVSKGSEDTDNKEYNTEQVFVIVEEMPRFNGGDPAVEFRKYIAMNLRYPALAAQKGIAGRVIVQFVVTGEGDVTDARVAAGVDPLLDNEALRVVLSSPARTPGKQKGTAVKVFYTFPINFVIQQRQPEQPVTMEKKDEVFFIVEEMPRFNGGDPAVEFRKFIAENLVYPQEAARDTVSGRVVAQFVVSAEGTVRDVEIKESTSEILK